MDAVPENNLQDRAGVSPALLGSLGTVSLSLPGPCLGLDVTLAEIQQLLPLPLGQSFTPNVGTVTLLLSYSTCCSACGLRLCGSVGSCWRLVATKGKRVRCGREKLRDKMQTWGLRVSGAAENGEGQFLWPGLQARGWEWILRRGYCCVMVTCVGTCCWSECQGWNILNRHFFTMLLLSVGCKSFLALELSEFYMYTVHKWLL